ncbi:glycoside hydrolase family 88 protein [Bosea sp. PAMC 26642]|uniref:glycoside hydrolase family 88 protein n=1 Tax=Bosea sp. (strain PAMC 26642) TaxID=1792307 RepID=UPI00143AD0DF|nr:glycoside hydrolase family 88 protein [Bosea sp. PAMC 26642]
MRVTLAEVGTGWPHYADPETGRWTTTSRGDWTGCYWAGMLWIAEAAGAPVEASATRKALLRQTETRAGDDTVSRAFIFYFGAALGAILGRDREAERIAVLGARALARSYNPRARIIPIGSDSEEEHSMGPQHVTIDGLVGSLPLLAWAAQVTGDGELRHIAREDALRHREFCVRDDGSVCQSAQFDPRSGDLVRRYTHKGFSHDSTWGRAQAWAIVAFAAAAKWYPEEPLFLSTACAVADWWLAHAPADDCVLWDFDAPLGSFRDSSASAIAAAGLLKLAPHLREEQGKRYHAAAERQILALSNRYLTPIGAGEVRPPGMLIESCYNPHVALATRHELIWGSYYLYEGLAVLAGRLRPDVI